MLQVAIRKMVLNATQSNGVQRKCNRDDVGDKCITFQFGEVKTRMHMVV